MTWLNRLLTSHKEIINRAPCVEDGPTHLQGKALGQGEYSGQGTTRRIEAIKLLASRFTPAAPGFYAQLWSDPDVRIVNATLAALIGDLPTTRPILREFVNRPVDDSLDEALRLALRDPVRALGRHPGVVKVVLVLMRNRVELGREELARKMAASKHEAAHRFLLKYCSRIAVEQGAKKAPFLLLADVGRPMVKLLVPQLDANEKEQRKLALKALAVILRRDPQQRKIRDLIQGQKHRLGRRGQAKVDELFRVAPNSAVPTAWDARNSRYTHRNWCW